MRHAPPCGSRHGPSGPVELRNSSGSWPDAGCVSWNPASAHPRDHRSWTKSSPSELRGRGIQSARTRDQRRRRDARRLKRNIGRRAQSRATGEESRPGAVPLGTNVLRWTDQPAEARQEHECLSASRIPNRGSAAGANPRGRASARPGRDSGRAHKSKCTLLGGARQLQALVMRRPRLDVRVSLSLSRSLGPTMRWRRHWSTVPRRAPFCRCASPGRRS